MVEHFYTELHGWFDYSHIYERMVREAPLHAKFVEIGSFKGRSAAFLAVEIMKSGKDITLTCIDPDTSRIHNLRAVASVVDHITEPSPGAARHFQDDSLDFIWIDGDHSEQAFRADVEAWLPKLKIGGWMGGHDYDHPAHPGIALVCIQLLPGHEEVQPTQPNGMVTSFIWQKTKP